MSRTDLRVALLLGLAHHPLAQADKRVLRPGGHGVGQLAQLNGETGIDLGSGFLVTTDAWHSLRRLPRSKGVWNRLDRTQGEAL